MLISLLPILSKTLGRLTTGHAERMQRFPRSSIWISQKHSTVQQCHRIVTQINNTFGAKQYRSELKSVFFYFLIIIKSRNHTSAIENLVSVNNQSSEIFPLRAGAPQDRVLGPFLSQIVPTSFNTTAATIADDYFFMKNIKSRELF